MAMSGDEAARFRAIHGAEHADEAVSKFLDGTIPQLGTILSGAFMAGYKAGADFAFIQFREMLNRTRGDDTP